MATAVNVTELSGAEIIIVLQILVQLSSSSPDIVAVSELVKALPESRKLLKEQFDSHLKVLERLQEMQRKVGKQDRSIDELFRLFKGLQLFKPLWKDTGADQKFEMLFQFAPNEVASCLETLWECLSEDNRKLLLGWGIHDTKGRVQILKRPEVQEMLKKAALDVNTKTFFDGVDVLFQQSTIQHKRISLRQRELSLRSASAKMLARYVKDPLIAKELASSPEKLVSLAELGNPSISELLGRKKVRKAIARYERKAQRDVPLESPQQGDQTTTTVLHSLGGKQEKKTKPVFVPRAIPSVVYWLFMEAFPLLVSAIAHRFAHKRKTLKDTRQVITVEGSQSEEMREVPDQNPVSVGGPSQKKP